MTKKKARKFKFENIHDFLNQLFEEDLHSKRVLSLANATLGVIAHASLAIHSIGHGLAQARGLVSKHAIKQVDRLLSNKKIDIDELQAAWVQQIIGSRKEIVVALDWTDFDRDDQSTLCLSLVTRHGRATPLMWKTHRKSELKGNMQKHESSFMLRFRQALPEGVKVTLLADRGFDDHKFMGFLGGLLKFNYVIRFRGNIHVEDSKGICKPAGEWVGAGGRAKTLRDAKITGKKFKVDTVVCVHAKGMKDPWCLASNIEGLTAKQMTNYYSKRWTIETGFRDAKDLRFGMGMSNVRTKSCERRDRLFLLNAFAVVLLTVLGEAGESLGFDRLLKANTSKRRTYSLFRQGSLWYDLIPNMPEKRLRPLMERFGELVRQQSTFDQVYGYV
jgi:hypothetical protein